MMITLMDRRYVGKRWNGTVKDHLRDVVENCSQWHAHPLHIRNFRQIARRYTRRISGKNHFERDAKSVTT